MSIRDAHLRERGPIVPVIWYDREGSGPLIAIVERPDGRWISAYLHVAEGRYRVASPVSLVDPPSPHVQ